MICISLRSPRISVGSILRFLSTLNSSCPLNTTDPALGVSRLSIVRPVVDLPQPDSPTRPKISPRRMEKLTSLTART